MNHHTSRCDTHCVTTVTYKVLPQMAAKGTVGATTCYSGLATFKYDLLNPNNPGEFHQHGEHAGPAGRGEGGEGRPGRTPDAAGQRQDRVQERYLLLQPGEDHTQGLVLHRVARADDRFREYHSLDCGFLKGGGESLRVPQFGQCFQGGIFVSTTVWAVFSGRGIYGGGGDCKHVHTSAWTLCLQDKYCHINICQTHHFLPKIEKHD
jgi:hypothetical protein